MPLQIRLDTGKPILNLQYLFDFNYHFCFRNPCFLTHLMTVDCKIGCILIKLYKTEIQKDSAFNAVCWRWLCLHPNVFNIKRNLIVFGFGLRGRRLIITYVLNGSSFIWSSFMAKKKIQSLRQSANNVNISDVRWTSIVIHEGSALELGFLSL